MCRTGVRNSVGWAYGVSQYSVGFDKWRAVPFQTRQQVNVTPLIKKTPDIRAPRAPQRWPDCFLQLTCRLVNVGDQKVYVALVRKAAPNVAMVSQHGVIL